MCSRTLTVASSGGDGTPRSLTKLVRRNLPPPSRLRVKHQHGHESNMMSNSVCTQRATTDAAERTRVSLGKNSKILRSGVLNHDSRVSLWRASNVRTLTD